MVGKVFLAEINNIAKDTRNGTNVKEAMRRIMKITNKLTHSLYVLDLLKTLKRRRIGTNSIEHLINRLCHKGSGREMILDTVMKNRVSEAHKELRRSKYENQKIWRMNDDILIEEGVLEGFLVIWNKEKLRYRQELKELRKKKVKWLCKKFAKKKEPLPEQYKGYNFRDQELGDEFSNDTVVYSGVEVTQEENEALKLHPKYTTFEKIDTTLVMTEIEKALTKIRWERKSIERRESQEGNEARTEDRREAWKNIETQTIDMRNLSSTDLPFNSRVYLPEGLDENTELEMHMLKNKLKTTVEEYERSNKTMRKNLTAEQKRGIKSLKERRENGEIVIYQTDKSAKMAVDTAENYKKSMEPHVENDEIISKKDNKDIEKLMNAHAVCWIRFMQAGEQTSDRYRIKMSMKSKNNDPSCLYSLRKDHKKSVIRLEQQEDGTALNYDEGPPVRPVCDVSDGVSHKLSYLLSNIIDETCNGETVCNSTEEMLSSIEECNRRGIEEEDVIGSADVKSLYPRIPVDDAIDIVVQEFDESNLKVEGIDYQELGLYLALTYDREALERVGIGDTCPTRANTGSGRKPEITGNGIIVNKRRRFEPWIRARQEPDEEQKKKFKEALRTALKTVMKNHTYEFAQTIRKQEEGGPIGLDLTGTIAKIFMKWWDRQLITRMDAVGMTKKMYERYIDDIDKCLKETPVGARYINEELVCTEETVREDEDIPADRRTFEIVRQIANSIHPNIEVEVDSPTHYEDRKLPILDLKVWIDKVRTDNGEELKILHKHYIKPMANKYVIHRESAMSLKTKRTILTQMCLRVLLNNSEYLKMEEKKETVEFFMRRMQASGYDERFRYEVLKSAINAYEKIATDPGRPKYRGKETNTPRRRIERAKKRRNWFRAGGYESVMFIPATPNSELAKQMEEEIRNSNLNIKVVERPGIKVKRLLQKNDPIKSGVCGDNGCFVCTTSNKGNCRKSGITYAITCEGECGGDVYSGETHGNGYTRGKEHQNDFHHKRDHSVMWKHCQKKHGSEEQTFNMKITDYVRGDPTKRQIMEAVRIHNIPEDERINDKSEWIVGKVPTVTVTAL